MKSPVRRGTLAALTAAAVIASTLFVATSSEAKTGKPEWVGTWGSALTTASLGNAGGSLTGFNNQSIRMLIRTSVGGERVRIRISNAFGAGPITVGHATVGIPSAPGSPNLVPGSIRELTFLGNSSTTVFKGADALSDTLLWDLPALQELAVTLYFPTATGQATYHANARQSTFIYAGDRAGTEDGSGQTITRAGFYFLAGVDVARRKADGSILVYGDSISDGIGATFGANTRWPDLLAQRIVADPPSTDNMGVLNESLAGNQATHDGIEVGFTTFGPSGLARLDTDVFGQTDVEAAIVQLGVNDINFSGDSADRIIAGLKQLAAQLAEHGIFTMVCTIGPFEGFVGPPAWTPAKEAVRVAVNDYIRNQGDFDEVIDMDALLRDPANPTRLLPAYDAGDHIHPNDAGGQVLANAVPLDEI